MPDIPLNSGSESTVILSLVSLLSYDPDLELIDADWAFNDPADSRRQRGNVPAKSANFYVEGLIVFYNGNIKDSLRRAVSSVII
jgi:hypothetical protein